ncbi:hypothetical protein SHKM778_57160 [Streptomyces sp. KM77-8]|uniref:Uncharacterized protein n=1 Tax=Streptomyces haneummycinicus TaxID=3074435 RepID=A0AAT9HPP1_9ACTN
MAAQDERAEEFVAGGHGGDPVVPVPYRVAFRAGRLEGAVGCPGGLGEPHRAVEDL